MTNVLWPLIYLEIELVFNRYSQMLLFILYIPSTVIIDYLAIYTKIKYSPNWIF